MTIGMKIHNKWFAKDEMILSELERDSDRSLKVLAELLDIPLTTLHSRIMRFRKIGVITGYKAVIDRAKFEQIRSAKKI